jgi:hypothetical protein
MLMPIQVSQQSINLSHCSYYARADNIKMGFPKKTTMVVLTIFKALGYRGM